MNAIEIRNLNKNFGSKQAARSLNMTVPAGAIYGFIGENGSGKSTTEKLICGQLVPSGGEIKLFGKSYKDAGVRSKVQPEYYSQLLMDGEKPAVKERMEIAEVKRNTLSDIQDKFSQQQLTR